MVVRSGELGAGREGAQEEGVGPGERCRGSES